MVKLKLTKLTKSLKTAQSTSLISAKWLDSPKLSVGSNAEKSHTQDTIQNKYVVHSKILQSIECNSHETQRNSLQLLITNMKSSLWILMLKYRHRAWLSFPYLQQTPKSIENKMTKYLQINFHSKYNFKRLLFFPWIKNTVLRK